MKLYKLRRISDGRFYRGKSKFTLHGTYFRLQQIKGNMKWTKALHKDIELVVYDVKEDITVDIIDTEMDDIMKILNRDKNINDILNNYGKTSN
jgi:spore coat polysaccharide biosynthesis protein SpsF (cytidylyltransferase family)